ncbi:MAG: hypothetical protein JJE27_02185 [Thermoleophilia bacterium]|nr:hypothetical protein [Thermoleophilia bacterium]
MRDRMLHDALRLLTEDAARMLESRLNDGAEIPFEVGESGSPRQVSGTALFAYKPLTAEFVASHAEQLRTLSTFENAANHLARTRGTVAYLRLRDEPVLDVGELTHARLGVLAFLMAVWADAEHFEPWDERFSAAYSELESVALAERLVTTVFIPVHGLVLDCETVNLGAGVELMAAEDLDADCLDRFSDAAEGADCYCAVSVNAPSDAPAPIAAVRQQAHSLLTALRMFKPGSVSLGMTAQANVGGAWQQTALPFTGRSREEAWRLLPGEDEELRQFIGAVRRVERRTRVAWALKRFEMGLERSVPAEGLTDFLAALRALLEAHDDSGKAALPARVSALCARDSERMHVRATVEAAFALERLALDGHIGRADRKRLAKQSPLEVIAETERYLRALLHDLVCGYLATDLKKLADEILLADGEPTGPETAVHEPVYLEPVPDPGAPPPGSAATQEFDAIFGDTVEITAIDLRDDLDGGDESADSGARGDQDDNVWTLRPASEIRPAPESRPSALKPAATSDDSANAGFTFDFKVLDTPEAPVATASNDAAQDRRVEAEPIVNSSDPDFPVPEFELPGRRGPAAAIGDSAVDAGIQSRDFKQIMDENYTPPPRDLNERPTTPVARNGRPHLVAIDGNSARDPQPVDPPAADPRPTVEFDVLAEFGEHDAAPVALITPLPVPDATAEHPPLSSEQSRTREIGPTTIEFRPLVDPDRDDPDDFAGAC